MKTKLKNLAKIAFGTVFMFLILPAYAFDGATLSEIKISSKDNYSYKIVLKTNKDIPVEKFVTADNKIVIDLKNTHSAEFVNTIYNNTPEIDNVIVQSVPGDKVRVFIQGLNISSSKVIVDSRNETLDFMGDGSSSVPTSANTTPQSEVSAPAKNLQGNQNLPVINLTGSTNSTTNTAVQESANTQYSENNLQTTDNSLLNQENNNLETVKSSMASNAALKKIFSKEGFDWLLRLFAAIFIIIGAIKLLNKPKNVTIDLASDNIKSREMELYKTVNERKELVARSLGSNYTKERLVKNSAYGANSQYAMREYQNSQVPPQRLNRPVENPETRQLNNRPQINSALKTTKAPAETRKPVINNLKITQKDIKTAKTNIDNIKFLENMAAIYQKSGRTDLAHNIRQKINETRIAG